MSGAPIIQPPEKQGLIRFGVFEMDLRTGELRKAGVKIKLQGQPFKILTMLVENSGRLVTHEDIRKQLWGVAVAVDFEHSVPRAINKIRDALGDSADNPRFVETLQRRGYRFIGQINAIAANSHEVIEEQPAPALPLHGKLPTFRLIWLVGVAVACCLLGLLVLAWRTISPGPRIFRSLPITDAGSVSPGDPNFENLPSLVTDGTQIYFPLMRGGRIDLAQVSVGEGGTRAIVTPQEISEPAVADLSPDGSELLIRGHLISENEEPLWLIPTVGGVARRLGNLLGHDATWSPDGQSVIYASGNDLMIARTDGSDSRKLISVPGRAFWLRTSPDGRKLRFTVLDTRRHTSEIWQTLSDGKNIQPVLPGWSNPPSECCGNWTPDGKYFVFQSAHDRMTDLWAISDSGPFPFRHANPVHLTAGPLNFLAPAPSKDGKTIYAIGMHSRTDLLAYDPERQEFSPYLADIGAATYVALSRDRLWISYITPNDSSLWRSRVDGSDRLQLTSAPMQVFTMSWSPDAKYLALMGRTTGKPWGLYVIPSGGGNPKQLLEDEHNEADPSWSPDGHLLAYGRPPEYMAEPGSAKAIQIYDLRSTAISKLPGSEGLFSPHWSPDGRYIAAMPLNQNKLMIFDWKSRKWDDMAFGSVSDPAWSGDGKYIYFRAFKEPGQPVYRLRVSDKKVERIVSFRDTRWPNVVGFSFLGLGPNDSPILQIRSSTADIYALQFQEPGLFGAR